MSLVETIAVDLGYGYVKAISSSGKKILFPSCVGSGRDRGLANFMNEQEEDKNELNLSEMHIKIDGKHYYVGEMAIKNSADVTRIFEKERYHHEYSKILMNVAIQLVTKPTTKEVLLFTGLPLDYYGSQHQDFKAKLLEENPVIDWVSGYPSVDSRKVSIKNVGVFPQAMSAIWSALMNHDGKTFKSDVMEEGNQIGIIDIGFRTTDICVVEMKGKGAFEPLFRFSETIDQGVYDLYENIKISYQNKTGGTDLSESKIKRILERKSINYRGRKVDLSNEVNQAKQAVINSIIDRINKLWKEEADTFDYVFVVGGGGELFFNHLQNHLNIQLETIVSSQFANAIGYYRIGKMLFGEAENLIRVAR